MESVNELLQCHHYDQSKTTTPECRDYRIGWEDTHNDHINLAKTSNTDILITGDSIAHGLTRYKKVWHEFFGKKSALNFGMPGDKTQHVLWRIQNTTLPDTVKFVVLVCGTNNIYHDSAEDIADGILVIGLQLLKKYPNLNVLISGILPREEKNTSTRLKIEKINDILLNTCKRCLNLFFMAQDDNFTTNDGALNNQLYFYDKIHLVEEGNFKLAKTFANKIKSIKLMPAIVQNRTQLCCRLFSYGDFSFKEEDFPTLLPTTKVTAKIPLMKPLKTLFSKKLTSRCHHFRKKKLTKIQSHNFMTSSSTSSSSSSSSSFPSSSSSS